MLVQQVDRAGKSILYYMSRDKPMSLDERKMIEHAGVSTILYSSSNNIPVQYCTRV
jgi:hypothetical protein